MASWRYLIGENGRLARHPQGRQVCVFVLFSTEEIRSRNRRAPEFGITESALLHLAGWFFVLPSSAVLDAINLPCESAFGGGSVDR